MVMKEWDRWFSHVTEVEQKELTEMKQDEAMLQYRFSRPLEFGTAGLRGIMGMGLQAMNIYTVRQATQALAEVILEEGGNERGVAIAWDSRINSERFAHESARVLAANGIVSYVFDELRPTPALSFAVRKLHCIAGINITASHNPKEYNGYKAYWQDGAQLSQPYADRVAAKMEKIDLFDDVKLVDYESAKAQGLIKILDESFDEKYLDCVLEQASYPGKATLDRSYSIVYTPLHGAGYRLVPKALARAGYTDIVTVAEQMIPDGNFPTVPYPNPEAAEAFDLCKAYAVKVNSDLMIASDPDADRLGVTLRRKDGSFLTLTGNQIGALLAEYLFCAMEKEGTLPAQPYMVTSIVSTPLLNAICLAHGASYERVLTGFRFIGEAISKKEKVGNYGFIFAFEESYGYLKGTYARDKDAVEAAVLVCEMASYYRSLGKTLEDALNDLYAKYGFYMEKTVSVQMGVGIAGKEKMASMMASIRANLPKTLGEEKVVTVTDYAKQIATNVETGDVTPTGIDPSNVLAFETAEKNVVIVRPSGTEPKVKFYYLVHGETTAKAQAVLDALQKATQSFME